jgi:hypothetical protein
VPKYEFRHIATNQTFRGVGFCCVHVDVVGVGVSVGVGVGVVVVKVGKDGMCVLFPDARAAETLARADTKVIIILC